jgi:hypothetical protein
MLLINNGLLVVKFWGVESYQWSLIGSGSGTQTLESLEQPLSSPQPSCHCTLEDHRLQQWPSHHHCYGEQGGGDPEAVLSLRPPISALPTPSWSLTPWTAHREPTSSLTPGQEDPKKGLGIVRWFNIRYRYDFINRNDTQKDVFVQHTAIKKTNPREYFRGIGLAECGRPGPMAYEGSHHTTYWVPTGMNHSISTLLGREK